MIETRRYVAHKIEPDKESMKIQFTAIINGAESKLDPFVSCHLEWWEAHRYTGKRVAFDGWRTDGGCYLISEVVSVDEE
jgi:hypothetical protein